MQPDELELNLPPVFEIGQKVRLRKLIKNDGTFAGKEVGEVLGNKGDIGYIASIGTYLQNSYIYAVHFLEKGFVVGCRKRELEAVEENS
ncbi:nitrogen fixation protein NifZ [Nodularia spumigena CS-584]|jgi:nitrogen fixation protein NifZ|uniref:Nitrogen fixation protein NifZ n=1 Tax=Nodularia spumigena CENA596 TaxID=1819295 RepID=A0A166IHE2_NODSP|nr:MULTISPECIES: nitrogen fixation protein NifZ [Cyanophyceae]MDB9357969.1 nitrogen fixation protein NifZ [Nodularia spumigena CS-587/03]MDB9384592.1 nitrogen fixation protein NifZ [Nodularia spumigena CS-584]AHJ30353.1 NifZ protein [Nodularia spumigena CCY9414]EAW47029.1 NifZ [Nodularia spumigena CCY9414]KZL48399.1 nitrogen fixation protein NifZ [Nodularia spumigena CENA596]